MPIDKYEKSTVTLLAADEKPDASLVSHFLNRYKMVNGCLQERSGPAEGTCACYSLGAILWSEIAARHQLQQFADFARLWAEMRDVSAFVREESERKALWMWLRGFWLDPLLDGRINPRHRPHEAGEMWEE